MNTERSRPVVLADAPALARAVAEHVLGIAAEAIDRHGRFDIALSGGSTPKAAFAELHAHPNRTSVDWSLVRFFFGDERCVPPDDDQSNYKMAKETLLDPLGILPHAVFRMAGEDEPLRAAQEYAGTLRHQLGSEPVFDLILLGMGTDGHTASLFPGTDPTTDDAELVRAVWVDKLSTHRITLTPHVINNARNVSIAVEGPSKADALAAVLEGPYRPAELPIQIVSPRTGTLTWLADRAAVSKLG